MPSSSEQAASGAVVLVVDVEEDEVVVVMLDELVVPGTVEVAVLTEAIPQSLKPMTAPREHLVWGVPPESPSVRGAGASDERNS